MSLGLQTHYLGFKNLIIRFNKKILKKFVTNFGQNILDLHPHQYPNKVTRGYVMNCKLALKLLVQTTTHTHPN